MPISSINPATAEVLKTFDSLSEAELEAKLARAAETFREHSLTSFADRAQRMQRAAEMLDDEKKSLARTMTLEMGKPINAAVQEAEKCAWVCRYYAENAEKHLADEIVATNATTVTCVINR
jgi:succinate-semialdehyde dehydrogenase/glutarate-semialdehyde dehydrogenase